MRVPFTIANPGWSDALKHVLQSSEWHEMSSKVKDSYTRAVCYPPMTEIFKVFELTPIQDVRVVILGQDPYHGPGQANGLAFSVSGSQKVPPSLKNILKEVAQDTGGMPSGDLSRWAKHGVFLLNSVLSVQQKLPGSHSSFGWQVFTDEVIRVISLRQDHVVFMLWGNFAHKKETLIDPAKHLILKAPHPSPLSAYQGYLGCRHFSKANKFLIENGFSAIQW
jgi:uracil-DNA glycosylase